MSTNSFDAKATLTVGGRDVEIFRLDALQSRFDVARLPYSLKILLENLLRTEGTAPSRPTTSRRSPRWDAQGRAEPRDRVHARARLMQDFTGVPAVVDLAAMRDAMAALGGDPAKIEPLVPGRARDRPLGPGRRVRHAPTPFAINAAARVRAQPRALRVPALGPAGVRDLQGRAAGHRHRPPGEPRVPGAGRVRRRSQRPGLPRHARRHRLAHDDDQRARRARLGRRRHRGRGGDARPADVDADPAGRRLRARRRAARGRDRDRPRAHRHRDAARERRRRQVRRVLRPGLSRLPLADRATIGNMCPEYGSTCAIFPIDAETLRYLAFTGRPAEQVALVEAYAKEQGLWHDEHAEEPTFSEHGRARPRRRSSRRSPGPRRPQDRVPLRRAQRDVPRGARRATSATSRTPRTRPTPRASPRATRRPTATPGAAEPEILTAARPRRRSRRRCSPNGATAGHARRRDADRARPRPRRDRRDHELHEHVEPVGDARRRPAGAQRASRAA